MATKPIRSKKLVFVVKDEAEAQKIIDAVRYAAFQQAIFQPTEEALLNKLGSLARFEDRPMLPSR